MPYNTTAIPPRKEVTGQTQLPQMFIQHLASEAQNMAKAERKPRRNVQYKDVAAAVSHHDNLEFLEDVVPKTSSYKAIKAQAAAARARVKGGSDVVVPPAGTAAAVVLAPGPVMGGLAAPEGVMLSLEQGQVGDHGDERDRMAMLPNAKKQKGSGGLQQTSILMSMNGGLPAGTGSGASGSIGGLAAPVNGLGAGGVNTGITNMGVTTGVVGMSSASGRPFSSTPGVMSGINRGILSASPPATTSDEDPSAQLQMEMRQAASQQYRGHDGDVDMTVAESTPWALDMLIPASLSSRPLRLLQ
ncbi:hypothetical protein NEUTE1DRAFT_99159 [Neurospora tetrasperma FGSC 2508]|uniref:Transcription factor CBF/NF-Y/archaeal histone domain-containing protein n=1 Tax=Neurospora tetrasperma (strain FGSC 2508 / ATCC MYA-4615 / P0657) TaxID=510951 RepID=F8MIG6_NEUT8|nr:uncharacterized protein NEUTE1DRAFT_99159 [Neurospora tetrasperma FGSC 2508]EGO58970.1 hypothetical protein NEUTE1DRAFT_99159 [Neurospora tetrasperma FGSC 2508]